MLFEHFRQFEAEAKRLMEAQCVLPAYEMVLKCSHTFNLLDARGAISVTERAAYIGRVRDLARLIAQAYYESRERLGFPLVKEPRRRRRKRVRMSDRDAPVTSMSMPAKPIDAPQQTPERSTRCHAPCICSRFHADAERRSRR